MPHEEMSEEHMRRIVAAAAQCPYLFHLVNQARAEEVDSCELAARLAEGMAVMQGRAAAALIAIATKDVLAPTITLN